MEECQNILEIRNLKKSYMINKENSYGSLGLWENNTDKLNMWD